MNFTKTELEQLSDGVILLLENAGQAKKLLNKKELHEEIDEYMKELQMLNSKICSMI